MADFLKVFEAKALAAELTKAGHSVSERTVQRWKAGITRPKPQDLRAIHELLGIEKEPQPQWAGAMETRLRLELERNRELISALAPEDIRLAAEQVIGRLEARLAQGDEAPGERNGSEDQDAAELPGRGPG